MMTLVIRMLLLALLCTAAFGQRLLVESDTIEGQLLQQIDAEQDAAKRLPLLERFAKEYPNHEAVTWVLAHLQAHAFQTKDYTRVLQLAIRILSLDPDDVSAAHNALRAVEAKGDPELIRRWSQQTSLIARRVQKSKEPEDPEELADWKARVEFARQVDLYSEYSLSFAALSAADGKARADLIRALENRNPKSEYLAQMRTSQATVARQVDVEEAVRAFEESYVQGSYSVDQLFMAATYYMQKRTAPDKVVTYGLKLLDLIDQAPRPQEYSEETWAARRKEMLGQTHWMVGLIFSTQERFQPADKHLREAMKYIRDRQDMAAGALYHLGYVNYRMAEGGDRVRIHDAVRFTFECSRIQSAVQMQAQENLKSMRAEYALPDSVYQEITGQKD